MNKCNKTGLTDKDWTTILDVINVFDPNDISRVYPEMGTPDFARDVHVAFKAVLAHVERNNLPKSHGGRQVPQYGPETIKKDHVKSVRTVQKFTGEAVDPILLANQQWLHDS